VAEDPTRSGTPCESRSVAALFLSSAREAETMRDDNAWRTLGYVIGREVLSLWSAEALNFDC
jgi:hypothetical protein